MKRNQNGKPRRPYQEPRLERRERLVEIAEGVPVPVTDGQTRQPVVG
jgi:hypothetical protein